MRIQFLIAALLFMFTAVDQSAAQILPMLKSKKAVCCNEFDGRPPEAIWELSDGTVPNVHYRVQLENQWVDVPDDAVLEQPNKYGVAVVWYSVTRYGDHNSFFIRCFLPGQLI